jgi:protein-disulfide isomerase-like protein with CxxC motif
MRKLTAAVTLALGLAAIGMAADFKGFVEDEMCSTKPEMKGNAACAQRCIKGGSPAVLITDEGKIYKIANQAKIVEFAGKNVTVSGVLKDGAITVASVK